MNLNSIAMKLHDAQSRCRALAGRIGRDAEDCSDSREACYDAESRLDWSPPSAESMLEHARGRAEIGRERFEASDCGQVLHELRSELIAEGVTDERVLALVAQAVDEHGHVEGGLGQAEWLVHDAQHQVDAAISGCRLRSDDLLSSHDRSLFVDSSLSFDVRNAGSRFGEVRSLLTDSRGREDEVADRLSQAEQYLLAR